MYTKNPLKCKTAKELTKEEVVLWEHISTGKTLSESASLMGIENQRVINLRRRLFAILDVNNVASLTRAAIRHGVITA
jgi:DNA-binding CsgD family transcriptional regulator